MGNEHLSNILLKTLAKKMTKLPLDVLLLGLVGCDDPHISSFATALRQQTLIHLSIEMKGNKLQEKTWQPSLEISWTCKPCLQINKLRSYRCTKK